MVAARHYFETPVVGFKAVDVEEDAHKTQVGPVFGVTVAVPVGPAVAAGSVEGDAVVKADIGAQNLARQVEQLGMANQFGQVGLVFGGVVVGRAFGVDGRVLCNGAQGGGQAGAGRPTQ